MTYNLNRIFYNIIRNKICSSSSNNTNYLIKKYTTQISEIKDPFPIFMKQDVHELLKIITRIDINNVIRHRKIGEKISPPEYKFLTDEQLAKEREEALERVSKNMQMPPILLPYSKEPKIIANDPEMKNFLLDDSKIIFFDISQDVPQKNRVLYVREPDGVLREGNLDEHTRMETIFFPLNGRKYFVPRMFSSPYLDSLFEREEYEFVLDRACLQFEPYDPLYIEIVQKTYKHIYSEKKFDKLRSTRHFGGLAFYLCWWNEIDNLVVDQLLNHRIEEVVALIKIYQILQPQSATANIKYEEGKDIEFIESYRNLDSSKKDLLELSIQNYIENEKKRKDMEEGQRMAHGVMQATT